MDLFLNFFLEEVLLDFGNFPDFLWISPQLISIDFLAFERILNIDFHGFSKLCRIFQSVRDFWSEMPAPRNLTKPIYRGVK